MTATSTFRLRSTDRASVGGRDEHGPQLRVVEDPPKRHTLAYALVMVVLLGASVFGAVTLNALAAGEAVRARELQVQVADAERAYSALIADVAALEDPGRIRDAAHELGLVPAGPARHVVVDRNLPADGVVVEAILPETTSDPVKPILSAER